MYKRQILSLKDRSYQPKPARREYIAKKNSSKKRPLGIQSGDDKLVQEGVKMILESIYEPVFSNKSHGFRPNRSCQTALKQIQNTFTGANWFVEGDIHACFDSFDHHVVIDLLKKRIDDEAFIQLIWKFLKAGYMEHWTFNRTYSGVPQGSGVSPVLANIYLQELDKFMGNYAENFNTEAKKKHFSTAYKSSVGKAYRYRKKGREIWDSLSDEEKKIRCKNLKELEMIEKSTTPVSYTHLFERVAKKYRLDFALKKDSSTKPPTYYVFFKGQDTEMMNLAFKKYLGVQMNKKDKPSIMKKLMHFKDAVSKGKKDVYKRQE